MERSQKFFRVTSQKACYADWRNFLWTLYSWEQN